MRRPYPRKSLIRIFSRRRLSRSSRRSGARSRRPRWRYRGKNVCSQSPSGAALQPSVFLSPPASARWRSALRHTDSSSRHSGIFRRNGKCSKTASRGRSGVGEGQRRFADRPRGTAPDNPVGPGLSSIPCFECLVSFSGNGSVPNPSKLSFVFKGCWCGREDSNFHGLSATTTSTLRVYQFRHDRTPSDYPGGPGCW